MRVPVPRYSKRLLAVILPGCLALCLATSARAQNPLQSIKNAYKKAKQQQQSQSQPQQGQQGQQSAAPSAAQSSAASPWTPPSDSSNSSAPPTHLGPIDPSKMPDVVGVHLGMKYADAIAAMHRAYPGARVDPLEAAQRWPGIPQPVHFTALINRGVASPSTPDVVIVDVTAPPDDQVVWHVARQAKNQHVDRTTVVEALRKKYGKETFAQSRADMSGGFTSLYWTDKPIPENQIAMMIWVYDESGTRYTPSPKIFEVNGGGCRLSILNWDVGRPWREYIDGGIQMKNFQGYCATSFVAVTATLLSGATPEIVTQVNTEAADIPLANRNANVSAAYLTKAAQQAHQQDLDKAKQTKAPSF